ncbi:MAG: fimbrial biogenesis chaperone [Janthinobacterium lividum]
MALLSRFVLRALAAVALAAGGTTMLRAQGLSILPITTQFAAGQRAAALTIVNHGTIETSFQVRAFAWSQSVDGSDVLTASDAIVLSPPLGTIPPGGSQVVRMILRQPPQKQETSFRLLLDQIPPPAAPGTVQVALRLSLPVFSLPVMRVSALVRFHVEQVRGVPYLVASNAGTRHDKIQSIELRDHSGAVLGVDSGRSPYVLPGAIRQWRIVSPDGSPPAIVGLKLSAHAEATEVVDQPVAVTSTF